MPPSSISRQEIVYNGLRVPWSQDKWELESPSSVLYLESQRKIWAQRIALVQGIEGDLKLQEADATITSKI
jgi:hypothetical protein